MTPQTITILIDRKPSERIQFSKELYDRNPQEWECETREGDMVRVLCTDREAVMPVIALANNALLMTCTIAGKFYEGGTLHSPHDLFMRRKSDEKLPEEHWLNCYRSGMSQNYTTEEYANNGADPGRIALVHVTYKWRD